jgi:hypothetical protein
LFIIIFRFSEHWSEFLASDSCLGGSCGSYALGCGGYAPDVLANVTPSGFSFLLTMLGSRFTALERSPFETGGMWRIYEQVKGATTSTGLNVKVNTSHLMTAETEEVITEYGRRELGDDRLCIERRQCCRTVEAITPPTTTGADSVHLDVNEGGREELWGGEDTHPNDGIVDTLSGGLSKGGIVPTGKELLLIKEKGLTLKLFAAPSMTGAGSRFNTLSEGGKGKLQGVELKDIDGGGGLRPAGGLFEAGENR